jgi:hypothetical protein
MHQIAARTTVDPFVPELFCYCPTMDLVATATEKGSVDVWRLNGQKVFGANFAKHADDDVDGDEDEEQSGSAADTGQRLCPVRAIGWKRDGECVAATLLSG